MNTEEETNPQENLEEKPEPKKLPKKVIIIGAMILISAGVTMTIISGNPDEDKATESSPTASPTAEPTEQAALYPCTSTAGSATETIPGYDVVDLFAVKTHPDDPDYDRLTSPPTISLSEFKEAHWPTYDVYYQVTKDTKLYTGFWGVAAGMEVCDENNMTNIPLDDPSDVILIPEDNPAASTTRYMHGGHVPAKPGTYRVDAYFFYDGKWRLTHQMEGLVFTK